MSRICDVTFAMDHMVRFTRPSGSVFTYCKQSKTSRGRPGNKASLTNDAPVHVHHQQTNGVCLSLRHHPTWHNSLYYSIWIVSLNFLWDKKLDKFVKKAGGLILGGLVEWYEWYGFVCFFGCPDSWRAQEPACVCPSHDTWQWYFSGLWRWQSYLVWLTWHQDDLRSSLSLLSWLSSWGNYWSLPWCGREAFDHRVQQWKCTY